MVDKEVLEPLKKEIKEQFKDVNKELASPIISAMKLDTKAQEELVVMKRKRLSQLEMERALQETSCVFRRRNVSGFFALRT